VAHKTQLFALCAGLESLAAVASTHAVAAQAAASERGQVEQLQELLGQAQAEAEAARAQVCVCVCVCACVCVFVCVCVCV